MDYDDKKINDSFEFKDNGYPEDALKLFNIDEHAFY
jgi:hypothetical protein